MSYLLGTSLYRTWHRAFFARHDCYYVEAKGPVLDIVGGKKIAGRPVHPGLLGLRDRRLRRAEILARPGLDLDKDECPVTIDHNQVDFAGLAGKIAGERFETFAFEEFLAAFFAPSAERVFIGRQYVFVWQQFSY